jgi:hypothetical protein
MTNVRAAEWWKPMSGALQPIEFSRDIQQKLARAFWQRQIATLDTMQSLVDGWIERRYVGSRAAMDASVRMCAAETPVNWFEEYQKWSAGALERLMADGFACQQHFMKLAEQSSPSLVPLAVDQEVHAESGASTEAATRVVV